MESWVTVTVIACMSVTLLISLIHLFSVRRRINDTKDSIRGEISGFTTADYAADVRCDICFDDIGDEMVSQCRCGKTYHLTCAEPTGTCPYCGADFKDFLPPREARHITCPRCGEIMHSNICSCGTVLPDPDGTFECRCGERMRISEAMCRKCGRVYDSRVVHVKKQNIPNQ